MESRGGLAGSTLERPIFSALHPRQQPATIGPGRISSLGSNWGRLDRVQAREWGEMEKWIQDGERPPVSL